MNPASPRVATKHTTLQVVLFLLAAILVGRSIPTQSNWQHWFSLYENWGVHMPFQGRCLTVPLLHWAAYSPLMNRLSNALKESSLGPDNLMLQIIDVVSILALGAITVPLRRFFAPAGLFPWLAPFLVLWGVACTYSIRYESRFYMPYDLPALVFFSLGLLACLESRTLLLLAVMLIGTYNRETTIFLVPIWLACNWREGKLKLWAAPIAATLVWLIVKLHIRHITHGEPSGLDIPPNWRMLVFPHHWAQILSIAGFLIWPVLIFRGLITDPKLKMAWLGYIPLIVSAIVLGWWNATRIFGELIPLVAITATVEFEQYIRENVSQPINPQPLSP